MPNQKILHPAWRAHRRWRVLAAGALGTGFMWAVVLQGAAPSVKQNPWLGVPCTALIIVGAIALIRAWIFHCPNCGSFFHHEWGSVRVSFSECQHCGLPLWGDPWGARPPS